MCHLYEALMILPHCQQLCTYIWVQTSSSKLDILRGRCTCKFKYPLPMCHVYGYCELINSYIPIFEYTHLPIKTSRTYQFVYISLPKFHLYGYCQLFNNYIPVSGYKQGYFKISSDYMFV